MNDPGALTPEKTTLSPEVQRGVTKAIAEKWPSRIWAKDATVWTSNENVAKTIDNRLGWLDVPDWSIKHISEITKFADGVKADGFEHAVVLGMGGSSLCVEVLRDTFGEADGYPKMHVLDSTHPDQVYAIEQACNLDRTLFIVASKSGTTLEPECYYNYFWERLAKSSNRSSQFVAITDPGTALEKLGAERNFRAVFSNPQDIGGRYSALSYFGMLPAALMGINIEEILSRASSEAGLSKAEEERNVPLTLGIFMGRGAMGGRDKLTIVTDPELASFGPWAEQLIAESTGKEGKGILPVERESERERSEGEQHRLYVHLTVGEHSLSDEKRARPDHIEMHLHEKVGLGAEFFRWEFATAVAGAMLGINPFDEPNVSESKAKTNDVLSKLDGKSSIDFSNLQQPDKKSLHAFLSQHVKENGYIAIMAYLCRDEKSVNALAALRESLAVKYHVPVTVGFGPRFLHSTGQLHKGGPATGTFIQFVDTPKQDLDIPGKRYSFGTLVRAQAMGDADVLQKHGRPVICIDLGKDSLEAIRTLS
jgi:glucose-6-phosphate isomerase